MGLVRNLRPAEIVGQVQAVDGVEQVAVVQAVDQVRDHLGVGQHAVGIEEQLGHAQKRAGSSSMRAVSPPKTSSSGFWIFANTGGCLDGVATLWSVKWSTTGRLA